MTRCPTCHHEHERTPCDVAVLRGTRWEACGCGTVQGRAALDDAASWAEALAVARTVVLDLIPEERLARETVRVLRDAILALACAEHPDEPPRCAHLARRDAARHAAAVVSPAAREARRRNAAKARKARSSKALQRRKKKA